MVDKKAAIGIQINWLFVLIAGAVILIVVFSFIVKQKKASQIKAADTLLKDIEAITTGAASLKSGAQQITLPKLDVEFSCTDECECTFNVGPASKSFKDKPIFAPDSLSGVKGIFWTKDFEVPFRVVNFLYVTDSSIKYYFVYTQESELKKLIEKNLPEKINYEFVRSSDLGTLKNKGLRKTKFVFLDNPINKNLDRSFRDTSSFILLSPSEIIFEDNKINYVTEAELFGAIFAEDYQMYYCNIEKAKERLRFVADVYQKRLLKLDSLAGQQNLACGYQAIATELGVLKNDLNIGAHYNQIKTANEEFLIKSCPLIY